MLSTNKVSGTRHKNFSKVAEQFKLNHRSARNATIADIKEYKKKGYLVIVCYQYPPEKIAHYAIVKSIGSKNIYLYNPYFGEYHGYPLPVFEKNWKSHQQYENEVCWFFAIKK
ncbi:hypothetical protein BK004_04830 [bacterium CG10_46_32]|nr:MAG: hypothetical protein BK004_04830 [bacterium CG10_46_32]